RRGGSRRHLARTDKGDEAELPDWHRMQAGDRLEGPIPGHGPQGVPLRSDAPRRLRVMQPVAPRAVPTRAVPRSSMSAGGMDATARRVMAVAGRARACAWLFSPPAGASQAAV
ncbi:hypothetical protein, partial [Pigmentiphaga sp.]|uniref:hypothetical protein n=1 Tax=Pigmentiphaga sp. TaxID=1977564 RepID=UPI0025E87C7A